MSLLQVLIQNYPTPGFYTHLINGSYKKVFSTEPLIHIKTLSPPDASPPPPPLPPNHYVYPYKVFYPETFGIQVPSKFPYQKVYETTQDLLHDGKLESYRKRGFVFLRRHNLSFRESLRNPVIGCQVELFSIQVPGSFHIDSVKGKKILHKLCYY
jgi:hypothetical protein